MLLSLVFGMSKCLGTDTDCVWKNRSASLLRRGKCSWSILWYIGIVPGVDCRILLFISLATLWYIELKVNEGSKHWASSDEICCLWKCPWLRKFENSPRFRIVISIGDFAFDLNEIGFPFSEYIPLDRFVIRPSSGKSSLVFCLKESCLSFWCLFCLVIITEIQ